ncbi:MAG: PAS domain-containing sensor histidine kinase [Legionellales bacterium]|jgi:PAS domain S-box-containing protein
MMINTEQVALDNIIANLPGHVYWKDKDFIFRGCNELQAKASGYTREEVIGKTDYDMPWKDEADILRKTDADVMATGKIITREEPAKFADGTLGIFLSKKIPLRDKQNNIIGVLGISFDITAEKEAEELRFKNKVLEEQEQVTRLLAASMAHELRTPLRAIESGAEGIAKFLPLLVETYKKAREANLDVPYIAPLHYKALVNLTNNTRIETRAAFAVIDMLLVRTNLSHINTENFTTCSMGRCITEAVKRYPIRSDEKNLIRWKKCDFSFHGDELLMTHIIFNLLKNALYYVKAANKGEIQIWCDKNDKFNILHFKDTGQGMDAEVLSKLFTPFFTNTYHGTGVGLAFCKLVMQAFGGDITCDSVKGEYTDFTMTFPRMPLGNT